MPSLLEKRINRAYDFHLVLEMVCGQSYLGDSIYCPFHVDHRRSAKIYHDPDGDRVNCFTEGRSFTISDLLKEKGCSLQEWDPGVQEGDTEEVRKEEDFSYLNGYASGEFGIETFCRRLLNGG